MTIRVLRPGVQTTVQDRGRWGWQRYGIIVGGAMDAESYRTANLLVGNEDDCAAIEMSLVGATLVFDEDTLIAICGADMSPTLEQRPLPMNRPVLLRRGTTLTCLAANVGCRAYLAVAGGIDVPLVLNSRSTYTRANLGGFAGRSLKSGDELSIGAMSEAARQFVDRLKATSAQPLVSTKRSLGPAWSVHAEPVARVLAGSEFDWFTPASQQLLQNCEFKIGTKSDRMGYRLAGPTLEFASPRELISEGVCPGTLQVPANGQPILLMADCATTGGYAKIAHVISADLPIVAQLRPGEKLRFEMTTMEVAEQSLRERDAEFERRRLAVASLLNQ